MAYVSLIVYTLLLFVRPQEWIPGLSAVPLLLPVMCITIFLTVIDVTRGEWHFKDAPQNWLVLGLFVAMLLSTVLSFQSQSRFNFQATTNTFMVFGKIVLLYFLISINLRSVGKVKGFIAVIVLGSLVMAVHGILQIHTGFGLGGLPPLYIEQEHAYRTIWYGFFNDPNDMAQALVVAMPFLISGIHRPGVNPLRRLVSLVAAGVVGYAIFLTGSRGGWLALAVMMIGYFLVNFRQKKISIVLGVLALGGLMVLAPARVQSGSTHDESAKGRIVAWGDGNRMLKSSPIFGIGKGMFGDYASTVKVAHNSFVQCWAELGLLGYFFWLGALFASVKDSYALGKERPDDPEKGEMGRLARILLPAWMGFLASAIFLTRTYDPELLVLIGLMAAMHAIRVREGGPLPAIFVRRDCRRVLAIELLSIPFLYVMMRFFW